MTTAPSDPLPSGGPSRDEYVVLVDESVDPHVVVYHDPQCEAAEQYRCFRTQLLANFRESSPKVLIITSSVAKEGKSISTANFGVALADLPGKRVCLVDGDLRKPFLDKVFGVFGRPGLADYLSGDKEIDHVLYPVCMESLNLVPAGIEPRRAIDQLGSDRFQDLLVELRKRFDFVLIDTPPTELFSDSIVMGGQSDGILLITRMQSTPRAAIERAIRRIEQAGGRVIGVFLVGAGT